MKASKYKFKCYFSSWSCSHVKYTSFQSFNYYLQISFSTSTCAHSVLSPFAFSSSYNTLPSISHLQLLSVFLPLIWLLCPLTWPHLSSGSIVAERGQVLTNYTYCPPGCKCMHVVVQWWALLENKYSISQINWQKHWYFLCFFLFQDAFCRHQLNADVKHLTYIVSWCTQCSKSVVTCRSLFKYLNMYLSI